MENILISLENVTKTYKMGKVEINALKTINLTIHVNEYVAIVGASGSGKSTLMNLIGCLDTPSSGKYILKGQDVGSLSDIGLAGIRNKEIGFVFQSFNLIPRMSALENVSLPLIYSGIKKPERYNMAQLKLERVGLAGRIGHKPNELSGGEKQRVAIARALVNNPSLILADEPTGNLDTKASFEIMDIFEDMHREGNTIILVTHEMELAARAKRIIRLKDGLVEEDRLT